MSLYKTFLFFIVLDFGVAVFNSSGKKCLCSTLQGAAEQQPCVALLPQPPWLKQTLSYPLRVYVICMLVCMWVHMRACVYGDVIVPLSLAIIKRPDKSQLKATLSQDLLHMSCLLPFSSALTYNTASKEKPWSNSETKGFFWRQLKGTSRGAS